MAGRGADGRVRVAERPRRLGGLLGRRRPRRHVGCDLELVEPRSDGFVTDFLTPAEQRTPSTRPAADRDAAANLIWSAKESALKVLQTGLRRDTRSVEIEAAPRRAGREWAPLDRALTEGGELPGWWRRQGAFVLTVASERALSAAGRARRRRDPRDRDAVHSWLADASMTEWTGPAAGSRREPASGGGSGVLQLARHPPVRARRPRRAAARAAG